MTALLTIFGFELCIYVTGCTPRVTFVSSSERGSGPSGCARMKFSLHRSSVRHCPPVITVIDSPSTMSA